MRDHKPIVLEEFNGLWARGDEDSVPIDHFGQADNIQYIQSGFETRDGLDTYRAIGDVVRLYNYIMQSGQSLLILNSAGEIYHSYDESTLYGPILTISGMDDFSMVAINGYAYITPFTRTVINGETREVGMADEFVYVYKGDGTPARKAAGFAPTQGVSTPLLVAYNSVLDGIITAGIHIIAVVFWQEPGGDSSSAVGPFPLPILLAPGGQQANIQNIPTTTDPSVTERRIYMSHAIDPAEYVQADADTLTGIYELFYVKSIYDTNITTSTTINARDEDLVGPFVAGTLPQPTADGISAVNTDEEGHADFGLHVIGVVYETDTGYLTAPGPEIMAVQTFASENRAILVENIPVSPDPAVIRRHLVASKAIVNYNGDNLGFQLYFIPGGTLDDNTTTELLVSFYDIELLDDASHLLDNFQEIPAGVTLTTFNGRMVLTTTNSDISVAYLSFPNEPEAIDQVDGVVIIPLDGKPITNAQEFRDVLYVFKMVRTYALNDNGDVPSTWVPIAIDQGIGASCHGIGKVLDSGGVNIDYLLIVDYSGLMVFNGAYQRPELSWKIADFWRDINREFFGFMQISNDSLNQRVYITLPSRHILFGDYQLGLNAKNIRWADWSFEVETTSIALVNTDTLIIGAQDQNQ